MRYTRRMVTRPSTIRPKKRDEAAKKKIAKLITDLRLDANMLQDLGEAAIVKSQT